ncbi:hypothetical protein M409DRAFT_68403 [Zasmidium cellare ATCC 36951]|uniref:Protein kinase domain-containing protein n=1 Tax=Zasmidium cellare ATCC 36951 TaxID=1080233 RepID=A0A6A6C8T3_ZASCE|nr:uncharacterized protein M409DRAFT_68403 [Zasmidium cellare ATCC 36951]KAF2163451.1 hypothetical protein M409DRAFT_68403 [Zasmidium cellare ATCC 36951]
MFQVGQVLKGRVGSYKLTRKLQDSVWLGVNQQIEQNVIVKWVDHFRTGYERTALLRFQDRTPHIRPLLDEVQLENGSKWPALVLKWLEDDTLRTSARGPVTRSESKRVGAGVLKALQVIHDDGYVHTDVKPDNILVNFDPLSKEITDVQLADLGSTVQEDSKHAKDGDMIGTALFRSTEAILEMQWARPTDVWSFGATMISLIYGGNFNLLRPDVPVDHDEYDLKILMKQNQFFGPPPIKYTEIADEDRLEVLTYVVENTKDNPLPFRNITTREVSEEDKKFLLKIMKIDPRDRPTVGELLEDEWFNST